MRLGGLSPITTTAIMAAALISFANFVQASQYYIDPKSCTRQQAGFIRNALAGATDMANIGHSECENPSPAQRDLIIWLFGDLGYGQSAIKRILNDQDGAARYMTESHDGELQVNDMKFYCDQKRFKKRKGHPNEYYDTDVEAVDEDLQPNGCMIYLAYTAHPVGKHWQIQFCPWFLAYATKQDVQLTQHIPAQIWAAFLKGITPLITRWPYTPIDAASVFDKVMLHELTHSHENSNHITEDVGEWDGYGWKNCRKLSTQRINYDVEPPVLQGVDKNADTFALYGSASLMISQGHTVYKNGTFRRNRPQSSAAIIGAPIWPSDQKVLGGSEDFEDLKNDTQLH